MKLRLAWLGDAEEADSYSGREGRILLRALARSRDILPLWFAVGSTAPPHRWNGVRVFPVPERSLGSSAFLRTLIGQQRPDILVSNLPYSSFSGAFGYLRRQEVRWMHRVTPAELNARLSLPAPTLLVPEPVPVGESNHKLLLPYIRGLDPAVPGGGDSSEVLQRLRDAALTSCTTFQFTDGTKPPHLVMRQHLFCNTSLSYAMFELTNALLELGVPVVPQDEIAAFSLDHIRREEELYHSVALEKYERVRRHVRTEYDPEEAVTVHFTLLKSGAGFSSLGGREVLYMTGNQGATPELVGELTSRFDMLVAPSQHVLRPFLQAGLSQSRGAVVPHGVDPALFSPQGRPYVYPTRKRFKFLQTSFPWINEKGFDLTVKAFNRAFSSRDDVSLVLRVPTVSEPNTRTDSLDRLQHLVNEEIARPGAPEILLVETDVELDRRGGTYTGADCYVHPLRAEGFGMTILEAMACGLPVIATPWSGPADFLSPRWAFTLRHSGLIAETAGDGSIQRYHVEPELDHLIYLMRYAYQHPDEAKLLGQRAAKVACENWSWKRAAVKLASLLSFRVSEPACAGPQCA